MTEKGPVGTALALLLVQIVLVLFVSRSLGYFLRRFLKQPMVISEIIAGIILGPTAMGRIPGFTEAIFPKSSLEILQQFANMGLVLFMFLIGLELNPNVFKTQAKMAFTISLICIAFPFALGSALSVWLHQEVPDVSFASFLLFIGVSMSITAFPVLARILAEGKLLASRVGMVTLAAAAVNDVIGWIILAFAISMASSGGQPLEALWTTLETTAFGLFMLFGVRYILAKIAVRIGPHSISQNWAVACFAGIFISAWCTEAIGIHALFGSFIFGAIFPKQDRALSTALTEKIEDMVVCFMLPLYFVASGLKTDLGLLDNAEAWVKAALIVLVACSGKILAGLFSAKLCGLTWKESIVLGILMNTRGLVELIVLNLGLELHVITEVQFAALVVMALTSTFMTAPLVAVIYPVEKVMAQEMGKAVLASPDAMFSLLLSVADERSAGMVTLARALSYYFRKRAAITVLHLQNISERPSEYMSDLHIRTADVGTKVERKLAAVRERAKTLNLPMDVLTFSTTDPAADIVRVAKSKQANYVILGWSRPLFSRSSDAAVGGNIVRYVLRHVRSNVAVLIDRGLGASIKRVLFPITGSVNGIVGTAALKTARLLAHQPRSEVMILQICGPDETPRTEKEEESELHKKGSRKFKFMRRVSGNPVGLACEEAASKEYDLVLLGLLPQWKAPGMQPGDSRGSFARVGSSMVDLTQTSMPMEDMISSCRVSLLIVHQFSEDQDVVHGRDSLSIPVDAPRANHVGTLDHHRLMGNSSSDRFTLEMDNLHGYPLRASGSTVSMTSVLEDRPAGVSPHDDDDDDEDYHFDQAPVPPKSPDAGFSIARRMEPNASGSEPITIDVPTRTNEDVPPIDIL